MDARQIRGAFRKNHLINGDFRVDQYLTLQKTPTNGQYFIDRWCYITTGTTATHTMSQDTTGGPLSTARFALKVDTAGADGAVAAGDLTCIGTNLEGWDIIPLRDKILTLSFWIKTNKAGTYGVCISNAAVTKNYVAEYTVSAGDAASQTWKRYTVTFTLDISGGGTWNFDASIGLGIRWTLMAGTSFTGGTTAHLNSWNGTTSLVATSNQVNFNDSTNNDWYIANVQLEVGSVPTDFEHVPYADEFNRCCRYAWVYTSAHSAFATLAEGHQRSATEGHYMVDLPVPMRIAPVLVGFVNGHWRVDSGAGISTVTAMSLSTQTKSLNPTFAILAATTSGMGAQHPAQLLANNTTSAVLLFNAEAQM